MLLVLGIFKLVNPSVFGTNYTRLLIHLMLLSMFSMLVTLLVPVVLTLKISSERKNLTSNYYLFLTSVILYLLGLLLVGFPTFPRLLPLSLSMLPLTTLLVRVLLSNFCVNSLLFIVIRNKSLSVSLVIPTLVNLLLLILLRPRRFVLLLLFLERPRSGNILP